MQEQQNDAVDASMTTQPSHKDDVAMTTQAEAKTDVLTTLDQVVQIPTATDEKKNAFDDVPPMSQHSEDQDAIMETQKVASKDQA